MVVVIYLAVLAAAFFFLIVLPQRRRMTAHRALIAALAPGDDVVTTGGVYGTIRSVGGTTVELEIAPGVVVTVARGAIAGRTVPEGLDGPLDGWPPDGSPPENEAG